MSIKTEFSPPIFVAVDKPSLSDALALAEPLVGLVGGLKLGLQFVHAEGPAGIKRMAQLGLPLFLDLKLHDIPNTVAGAVRSVCEFNPRFLTIHTSGGKAMMEAALEAAQSNPNLTLLGVTVLTSLDDADLADVGQQAESSQQVRRLATLATQCGMGGLVCSPAEIKAVRAAVADDTVLMVPGIRPLDSAVGDQKRVMDPAGALAQGADLLVIGRPISAAPDPAAAARAIGETLMAPHS